MAIDLAPLWNFNKPEVSEQRFRVALETATGDDALVLQTQIARIYGLRKDFSKAQEILKSVAKDIPAAGPEARARRGVRRTRDARSRLGSDRLPSGFGVLRSGSATGQAGHGHPPPRDRTPGAPGADGGRHAAVRPHRRRSPAGRLQTAKPGDRPGVPRVRPTRAMGQRQVA